MPSLADEIIPVLRDVEIFAVLMDRELEIIAGYCAHTKIAAGNLVFDLNDASRELFVVLEGEVLITRPGDAESELFLAQYGPGDSFGEMDLFEGVPRDATAVTLKDCELVVFPRSGVSFMEVLEKHPRISARVLYNLLSSISGRLRRTHGLIKEKAPWVRSMKRELFTDKLTGLFNRKFLLEEFPLEFQNYGPRTSLIMIKPDNFKEINDAFGHDTGDRILMLMSIFVQSSLRESDLAVRYRGDELAVVLPGTDSEAALEIAAGIGRSVRDMEIGGLTGGRGGNITVSMGVATYPVNAPDGESLVELAHEKMMKARGRGGNRIVVQR